MTKQKPSEQIVIIFLDKTFTAIKYRNEVKQASDGNKPELYYDFVKNICSRVVCNK